MTFIVDVGPGGGPPNMGPPGLPDKGHPTTLDNGPPAPPGPPPMISWDTVFMYGSLIFSLIATLLTIVEKEQLNQGSLFVGGSMIERCRRRQRDFGRHWRIQYLLSAAPPRYIQIALLFVACGLGARMMHCEHPSIRLIVVAIPIAAVPIYLLYTVSTTQTSQIPTPIALRRWLPTKELLYSVWHDVLYRIRQVLLWLPSVEIGRRSRDPSLPTVRPAPQNHLPSQTTRGIPPNPTFTPGPPSRIFSPTIRKPGTAPQWLTPADLTTLQETNVDDAKCVLWVLQRITDPEALDAAIRFATVIRWYEDGLDMEKTRELIASFLEECFDFNGTTPPGSRDRAYYSLQAIIWIHICIACRPGGSGTWVPPTLVPQDTTCVDHELRQLLRISSARDAEELLTLWYRIGPGLPPANIQWTSNALLFMSWACQGGAPEMFDSIPKEHAWGDLSTIPLNAVLNRLLTWCIFLGWHVDMDALRVQVKSYVISYFQPASFSRCCQSPLGRDFFSIVTSNCFGDPHLSPSVRPPLRHAC